MTISPSDSGKTRVHVYVPNRTVAILDRYAPSGYGEGGRSAVVERLCDELECGAIGGLAPEDRAHKTAEWIDTQMADLIRSGKRESERMSDMAIAAQALRRAFPKKEENHG